MRHVSTSFRSSDAFKKWEKRAKEAREQALMEGPAHAFKPKIWKELKDLLIKHNYRKCMYCEFPASTSEYCAAEHYRPKGKVTEDGSKIVHGGYYWLAYEWQNILLSCTKCNSSHDDGEHGSHPGKACEFPISKSRVLGPGPDPDKWIDDLVAEEPLLLHPYFDKPEVHFSYGRFGVLTGESEQGKATIRICDLNRPALREERERHEDGITRRLAQGLECFVSRKPLDGIWYGEKDPFSTYLNCLLKDYFEQTLGSKS